MGATPFLLAQERCAKEGHPDIRVSLRETSLAPAPLRGPAYKGHPWPIKRGRHRYLAASMRLAPLRNTSTRPPEGDRVASLRNLHVIKLSGVWLLLFHRDLTDDAQIPFRRPSGITVEGVERHGCRESCDGPWMALRQWAASGRAPGVVMERGNPGAAGRGRLARMSGCPSLWLLSLGQARATKRSEVTAAGWPEG